MEKIMLALFLLSCTGFVQAQNGFKKKTVQVLSSSDLTITGDTNINKFKCDFETSYLKEPQVIYYSQDGSQVNFTGAVLTLDNRGFDCGSKAINKDFNDLLKTEKYPEILLEINRVNLVSETKGVATICITIAGKQKFYDVPVRIKNHKTPEFFGTLNLNINDFNLEPPKKLFGIIVVKDDIQINFDLHIKK